MNGAGHLLTSNEARWPIPQTETYGTLGTYGIFVQLARSHHKPSNEGVVNLCQNFQPDGNNRGNTLLPKCSASNACPFTPKRQFIARFACRSRNPISVRVDATRHKSYTLSPPPYHYSTSGQTDTSQCPIYFLPVPHSFQNLRERTI